MFKKFNGSSALGILPRILLHMKAMVGLLFIIIMLGPTHYVFSQQERDFFDDFRDSSKIDSIRNVIVNTTGSVQPGDTGFVTLLMIDSTVSTKSNFNVTLNSVETNINSNFFDTVVDIDVLDAASNSVSQRFLLITDESEQSIFTFDRGDNTTTSIIPKELLGFLPADAFSYQEGGSTMVLVVGSGKANSPGRVKKFQLLISGAGDQVWEYPINDNSDSLSLVDPEDVVTSTGRADEVIICDTGNNRLIAVDTTNTLANPIRILIAGDSLINLNNPVDLEVAVPGDTAILLITDQGNHRVILTQLRGDTLFYLWQFGTGNSGSTDSTLTLPSDADILSDGNILISDEGNNRLIEVKQVDSESMIVAQFSNSLFSLKDADRIANSRTLVASKDQPADNIIMPKILAFTDSIFISEIFSFGRSVDYERLEWFGTDSSNGLDSTHIRLQMRSSNSVSDISNQGFFGPTSQNDFYELRLAEINAEHDGDRFYQFRAFLETANPIITPVLDSISVTANFIRSEDNGVVVSSTISDTSIITDWVRLEFPSSGQFTTIEVIDVMNDSLLATFAQAESPVISLDALDGRQMLRLRATLSTDDPFFMDNTTPSLLSWRLVYEADTSRGLSQIFFTDENFVALERYRFDGSRLTDSIFVSLIDGSLADVSNSLDTVVVNVHSASTNDIVNNVMLIRVASDRSNFHGSLPITFSNQVIANDTLEVNDGDVITVSYTDISDSTDVSNRTALVLLDTVRITTLSVNEVFNFIIAPNPYIARRHSQIRLRGEVRSGKNLTLRSIEIYNLAGDKVTTLSGGQLPSNMTNFSGDAGLVTSNNWWDIRTDTGDTIASGTYFAKFQVLVRNTNQSGEESLAAIRKFVIIQ